MSGFGNAAPAPGPARASGRAPDGGRCAFARLRSRDVDEHASRLDAWRQVYEQLLPGPFEGEVMEALFDGFQLFRETTSQAVHQSGLGRDAALMFGTPLAMPDSGYYGGRPIRRDSVIVLHDGQELDFRAPAQLDLVAVSIPVGALRRHAIECERRDIERDLRGLIVASLPPRRVEAFRRLLLAALEAVSRDPHVLAQPPAREALARSLLRGTLKLFGPAGGADAPVRTPTRSHTLVRRAQAIVRSRIEEPVTVEALCVELDVCRRTLQYAFHEVLGINPVGYLRAVRLNGAHRALKAAAREGASVQDVAARWGFWHLSHFAADYRRMFGERPSETLKRYARE